MLDIQEHWIRSRFIAQTFKIKVCYPLGRRGDTAQRFPVVYATDSEGCFGGMSDLAAVLQAHGEVKRFILVGIGYDDPEAAGLLRMRDLFTHDSRVHFEGVIKKLMDSPLVHGGKDLEAITQTTDAAQFLRFIREELVPLVAAHYPASTDDCIYFGYSAGATFGLYALLTQPEIFKRYILGSPAVSFEGHHFGIEWVKAFVESGRALSAKVFLSVGELEELKRGFESFDFVSGYYRLAKFLGAAAIPGLDLTSRIFPGETHATAWTMAYSHGLKTLLGSDGQLLY